MCLLALFDMKMNNSTKHALVLGTRQKGQTQDSAAGPSGKPLEAVSLTNDPLQHLV